LRSVEQLLEARRRTDAIMEITSRTDVVILLPLLDEHHRPALHALVPEVLCALPLGQERDSAADAAQPAHLCKAPSAARIRRWRRASPISGSGRASRAGR